MRCNRPLAPSRNEANSSRVNGGEDKSAAILQICAHGEPDQVRINCLFQRSPTSLTNELDLPIRQPHDPPADGHFPFFPPWRNNQQGTRFGVAALPDFPVVDGPPRPPALCRCAIAQAGAVPPGAAEGEPPANKLQVRTGAADLRVSFPLSTLTVRGLSGRGPGSTT